ncbi:phage holin family protein [Tenacibaculum finnmarkense genomovar finnmarkense]|uniref:phage holin family protein n=1 Tax=Tenacibaculum finnmarkense TaxID=2781243 RepID=UPI001EFA9004|nr:phage holin family protein [Tenacibaculum finnmarkense]MCG8734015.1 phage holin family protein [Tenacibaculum finnmarkense]MCM8865072.1 phage holin family protein [Tenacibaculum finnmarkense genomovar finnmarkense]
METKLLLFMSSFIMGGIISELTADFLTAKYQFIAIFAVVVLDAFFGIAKAFKIGNFETKKSFKAVFMLVAFWALLATVLSIEKGFPFASFLSEAILLPIILFQLISTLKNMQLVGLLNNNTLNKILSNIDKHKEI